MIPTVLLYNLDTEKGRKIKALCLTLKLRARSVAQEDFSQPLDSVLGLAPRQETSQEEERFSDELLVMAGLSSRQMNQLLQGFRRKENPAGGAEGGPHRRQWKLECLSALPGAAAGASGHAPGREPPRRRSPVKLLISPAKKMRVEADFLTPQSQPPFLEKSAQLLEYLRGLSLSELKRLLACNESLAQEAWRNFQSLDLENGQTPALLAYHGIQYQYMAPGLFTQEQLDYVGDRLRILSGFYGVLRPFDGVSPYRLEMQARMKTAFGKSLYDFWGDSLGNFLAGRGQRPGEPGL